LTLLDLRNGDMMEKELNGIDEYGKCRNCGSRSTTYSTEQKGEDWVWKKVCASCDNELEKGILEVS